MEKKDILNSKQQEAIISTDGPVLILAGAGSGKTRVITHRIAYLIKEKKINPWNIMAITFTNKAAGEMRERVDSLVGFGSDSIWVSTFHASCVRILRRFADRLGYDTNFTIYDRDDQKHIMKGIIKKLEIDTKRMSERALMGIISTAKNELQTPTDYELSVMGDFAKKKMAQVYREYQVTLKKNNAMDFDDLIMKTVELFKACPDVLEGYQERFLYIHVDEYQDTNKAQFELVRLLAARHRNLCVVGDDDQSIYKFRGADIRNILDFEKFYPDTLVIKLEQNYRSTQTILDAANSVIRNNEGRKVKALWTNKGHGNKIHFKQFDTAFNEAEVIVEEIRDNFNKGIFSYGDCAILYRTNAQARLLEERCVIKGVPYNVVGGTNFYARKEIKDILAYLKTIDNAQDDLAVRRIINIPKRGIGATTLERIEEYAIARNINFFDALSEAEQIIAIGKSYEKLKPFVTMIYAFRSKLEFMSLKEFVKDVLDTTGYIKNLEASSDEESQDRIENIEELLSKVAAFEELIDKPTLSQFLEEVALVSDLDKVGPSDDRLLLMTLHSSKGLEFPHVYLVGLEDGIFPSYMTIGSADSIEMEEERRLAYVGITRAKEELTITAARERMVHGETQYNPVSRFVKEITQELLDQKLPKDKAKDFMEYGDNTYERSAFKAVPFKDAYKSNYDTRPKAVYKRAATPESVKPYKATGKKSLHGIEGLSKGLDSIKSHMDYTKGDRVSHIKFGQGTVVNIEKKPRDFEVTVEFDSVGQRIMLAAIAKLKKE